MHGRPNAMSTLLAAVVLAASALCAAQDKLAFGPNDSLDTIRAKIKHNGYKFTVGHNWVYDLSPAEKAKMFKIRPAPPAAGRAAPNTDIVLKPNRRTAATSFDWRNYNGHSYIGPIRDQGKTGTCYAFGACAAAEGTFNFANGLYDDNCVDFSEMYVIWTLGLVEPYHWHYNDGNGSGSDNEFYELYAMMKAGSPEGAAGFEGVCYEADFPFVDSFVRPKQSTLEASKAFKRETFKRWNRVYPYNYADTTEQIKTAIATYGCVDAGVRHNSAFVAYESGVYEDTNTQPDASPYYYSKMTHAISLVGWDDNPPEGGGGCWILRNEWGPDWGENGYMRIKYFSARVNAVVGYMEAGAPGGERSITGHVTLSKQPLAGVTMSLTGADTAVALSTQGLGLYGFTGLADGAYTVTPAKPGFAFEPSSRQVKVERGDVTGCDFAATPAGAVLTMAVPPLDNAGTTYPPLGANVVQKDAWVYISAKGANSRYVFKQWSVSGDAELKGAAGSPVNEVKLGGDATVTASFDLLPQPTTVVMEMSHTFDAPVSTIPAMGNHDVPCNQPVRIEAVPGGDYSFAFWTAYENATIADPKQRVTTVTLVDDGSVGATFSEGHFNLSMDVEPDSSGATDPAVGPHTVARSADIPVTATPEAGYYFTHWALIGIGAKIKDIHSANTSVTLADDARLTANFMPIVKTAALTMAMTPDSSGTIDPAPGARIVAVGEHVDITATPDSGHYFKQWTVAGGAALKEPRGQKTSAVLTGDATVTATFMPIMNTATLTLCVDPLESGSTTNPGVGQYMVPTGAWTKIEAFPSTGYFFTGWNVVGDAAIDDLSAETTLVSLNGNATVTASFAPVVTTATLTLATAPDSSGSTNPSPGAQLVAVGDGVGIEAIPAAGHHFVKWTATEGASLGDPDALSTSAVLSGDATVTANFTPITSTATLTLAASGSGSTNPGVGAHSVAVGDRVAIEALPAAGFFFVRWTATDSAVLDNTSSQSTSAVLAGDATVTATFMPIVSTATLTMVAEPYGLGLSTNPGLGDHVVPAGASVEIEALPAFGYYFEQWTVSGDAVLSDLYSPSSSVLVAGDATVTALFAVYPVDFVSLGSLLVYAASELDTSAAEFTKKPSLWYEYTDPLKGKSGMKAPLKLLTKVTAKSPQASVAAEWRKKIPLYDSSAYWAKTTPVSQALLNSPIANLYMDAVKLRSPQFGKSAQAMQGRTAALACPSITNITGDHAAAGDKFTVSGMFFGAKAPTLYVECQKATSGGKTTYVYLKCEIVETETYLYQDAKGKAGASCMKIRSDDPADGTAAGWSAVTALYPKIKGATPTGYLVLDNKMGLATLAFPR